ncbi:MAG: response regulator [Bauldia sp.]|nr:response regulator [Bauldia sp.]
MSNRGNGRVAPGMALGVAAAALAGIAFALPGGIAPWLVIGGVAAGGLIMARALRASPQQAPPRSPPLPAAAAAPAPAGETGDDQTWRAEDYAEHLRQVSEARREAEAASAAKSRFLATVSHEIRTPLSGVLGLAGVLLDTEQTAEQETFTRAIRSSGELMLGLVDDMLDFAKIEAGRFDLNLQPAALEPLVEDVAELLAARAHGKGLDIAVQVAPGIAPLVMADAPRLRQVLLNLVGNAVKFTDSGGVTIVLEPAPGAVRFAVIDTGRGIEPADLPRIFDAASRPESERPRGAGSGLGLSISQQIVRQMGGDIVAEPRPEGGSRFSFTIALPPVHPADEVPTPAAPVADLGGRRILVAAPPGPAPAVLARLLGDAGATATVAESVHRAASLAGAAAAAGEEFHAVLIDPRIGDGALGELRTAAGRALPAAVLIAPGRRQSVAEMREAGYAAYLVRPVRRVSLLRIVDQLLAPDGAFAPDPVDQRPQPAPARAPGTGLRVLLAEDDAINALLIRSVLMRFGHSVTEVADGEAALMAVAEADPSFDVAILDLHLPAMDGWKTATAIRAREIPGGKPRLRLIAVTADALPEARGAASEAGFDLFLQKPVSPGALRTALANAAGDAAA